MNFIKNHKSLSIFAALFLAAYFALYAPDLPNDMLEAKYTNAASQFTDINGIRTHYRVQGNLNAPTLVLLHGSGSSLHTWQGWIDELSTEFKIITMDLPGHGLTGYEPNSTYDWPTYANIVDKLLTELNVTKFSIAGNSMGGAVAWNYAVMFPQKIQNLILIDSRGYPSQEPLPFAFRAYAMPIVGRLMTYVAPRYFVKSSLNDIYGDKQVSDEIVTLYQDLSRHKGNREVTRLHVSKPSNEINLPKINSIQAPTLIMWGAMDSWILPKYANNFAADIANSTIKIYQGLGHLPMEEAPKLTASDARNFILNSLQQ